MVHSIKLSEDCVAQNNIASIIGCSRLNKSWGVGVRKSYNIFPVAYPLGHIIHVEIIKSYYSASLVVVESVTVLGV